MDGDTSTQDIFQKALADLSTKGQESWPASSSPKVEAVSAAERIRDMGKGRRTAYSRLWSLSKA